MYHKRTRNHKYLVRLKWSSNQALYFPPQRRPIHRASSEPPLNFRSAPPPSPPLPISPTYIPEPYVYMGRAPAGSSGVKYVSPDPRNTNFTPSSLLAVSTSEQTSALLKQSQSQAVALQAQDQAMRESMQQLEQTADLAAAIGPYKSSIFAFAMTGLAMYLGSILKKES